MAYLVLARKWRPQRFEDVVGQDHVTTTLRNAIVQGRIAHAFLFSGPRGVGKTTVARLLARALNCAKGPIAEPCGKCGSCTEIAAGNALDVIEIDGASNTGVDNIRDLNEAVRYRPASGRFKIYIIDEVHMLSTAAFNALLKTLEEPPEHVKFIFATTEVHRLPPTVVSRCQRYEFKRIPMAELLTRLKKIVADEKIEASDAALFDLAREADGSMRDAQSLLDQVIVFAGKTIGEAEVRAALGVADRSVLYRMTEAVLDARSGNLPAHRRRAAPLRLRGRPVLARPGPSAPAPDGRGTLQRPGPPHRPSGHRGARDDAPSRPAIGRRSAAALPAGADERRGDPEVDPADRHARDDAREDGDAAGRDAGGSVDRPPGGNGAPTRQRRCPHQWRPTTRGRPDECRERAASAGTEPVTRNARRGAEPGKPAVTSRRGAERDHSREHGAGRIARGAGRVLGARLARLPRRRADEDQSQGVSERQPPARGERRRAAHRRRERLGDARAQRPRQRRDATGAGAAVLRRRAAHPRQRRQAAGGRNRDAHGGRGSPTPRRQRASPAERERPRRRRHPRAAKSPTYDRGVGEEKP